MLAVIDLDLDLDIDPTRSAHPTLVPVRRDCVDVTSLSDAERLDLELGLWAEELDPETLPPASDRVVSDSAVVSQRWELAWGVGVVLVALAVAAVVFG